MNGERAVVEVANGLSEAAAAGLLKSGGHNDLPSGERRTTLSIAIGVVREPIFLLLIACGTIYLVLGDKSEALMLLGFVFLVIAISITQERRTERALAALRDLSGTKAVVVRDGQRRRIPSRDVVEGDILVVSEGDRIAADCVLVAGTNVTADESLLTGESVPVRKSSTDQHPSSAGEPGGDDLPFLFSGTLVVQGSGLARVTATGERSKIGRIGQALSGVSTERTRTQRETATIVKRLAVLAFALSAVVAVVYGFTRTDWLHGILVGITLAMAILPEELPVVLTVFLGLGAWRIAKERVLARHIPAVEMLGSTSVLCVDKTGTLTENRMTLSMLFAAGLPFDFRESAAAVPDAFHELLEYSVLASRQNPFDPMERTLHAALQSSLSATEHEHKDWTIVREYPLTQELLATTNAWKPSDDDSFVFAAKGAPEAIFQVCGLPAATVAMLSADAENMARQGLRVLGVAKARSSEPVPLDQRSIGFEFVGLLGFSDPIRSSVPASIREAQSAGIRVIMVTGDFPATALSVARQIGLQRTQRYITGDALGHMNEGDVQEAAAAVDVFCRVAPEHKLRLVKALKANGEVVAMTGDGVNDAPALKAADIGIAMGERGTDVAREASSLVLLDDNFSSIVAAIRMGRRIFDNLRKAIVFVVAAHIPIVGMSIIPVVLGWPLLLLPVHILFLQLIIDPACSIAFEAEPSEPDIMQRPPRPQSESLFDRRTLSLGALQGVLLLAIVAAIYAVTLLRGEGEAVARAMTFASLVLADLGLIVANRSRVDTIFASSRVPNRALWTIILIGLIFLAVIIYVPPIRDVFSFGVVHLNDIATALAGGFIAILGVDATKRLRIFRPTG